MWLFPQLSLRFCWFSLGEAACSRLLSWDFSRVSQLSGSGGHLGQLHARLFSLIPRVWQSGFISSWDKTKREVEERGSGYSWFYCFWLIIYEAEEDIIILWYQSAHSRRHTILWGFSCWRYPSVFLAYFSSVPIPQYSYVLSIALMKFRFLIGWASEGKEE